MWTLFLWRKMIITFFIYLNMVFFSFHIYIYIYIYVGSDVSSDLLAVVVGRIEKIEYIQIFLLNLVMTSHIQKGLLIFIIFRF